ncbi:MAG: ABC transporter permease subunit [Chlamydiota bacterium]|nr:ABC transporter permease subunit [Chlamydiota bacterium]
MTRSRYCGLGLLYLFLYLPVLVFVLFSFNRLPPPLQWVGFTFRWYRELAHDAPLWGAFGHSCLVAAFSTLISSGLTLLFLFLRAHREKARKALPLFYGAILVPETLVAVSLLMTFHFFELDLGILSLIIAHTVLGLGFMAPMLYHRYCQLDPHLGEASEVLGASKASTFLRITLPLISPSLFTTACLVFIFSFDDVILAYFCSGRSAPTLPLYLITMLRNGLSPAVYALFSLLLFINVCLLGIFTMLRGRQVK